MKATDLKIGYSYAIGQKSDTALYSRAVVVQVKVRRSYRPEGAYSLHYDHNGVEVTVTHRMGKLLDEPHTFVTTAREILMPWGMYADMELGRIEALQAAEDKRNDQRERMARVDVLLREVLGDPDRRATYNRTKVTLTLDEIETLIVNLRPRSA
jgi:hypothetical protein